jgi:hypothetical protein
MDFEDVRRSDRKLRFCRNDNRCKKDQNYFGGYLENVHLIVPCCRGEQQIVQTHGRTNLLALTPSAPLLVILSERLQNSRPLEASRGAKRRTCPCRHIGNHLLHAPHHFALLTASVPWTVILKQNTSAVCAMVLPRVCGEQWYTKQALSHTLAGVGFFASRRGHLREDEQFRGRLLQNDSSGTDVVKTVKCRGACFHPSRRLAILPSLQSDTK